MAGLDALAAVGLAGNIVAFIDFGLKVAKTAAELRDLPSSSENLDHLAVARDLKKQIESSASRLASSDQLRPEEKNLKGISERCLSLATKLIQRLEAYEVRDNSSCYSAKKMWAATKQTWQRRDTDDLVRRLHSFRSEMQLQILVGLSKRATGCEATAEIARLETRLSKLNDISQDIETITGMLKTLRVSQEQIQVQVDASNQAVKREILAKIEDVQKIASQESTELITAKADRLMEEQVKAHEALMDASANMQSQTSATAAAVSKLPDDIRQIVREEVRGSVDDGAFVRFGNSFSASLFQGTQSTTELARNFINVFDSPWREYSSMVKWGVSADRRGWVGADMDWISRFVWSAVREFSLTKPVRRYARLYSISDKSDISTTGMEEDAACLSLPSYQGKYELARVEFGAQFLWIRHTRVGNAILRFTKTEEGPAGAAKYTMAFSFLPSTKILSSRPRLDVEYAEQLDPRGYPTVGRLCKFSHILADDDPLWQIIREGTIEEFRQRFETHGYSVTDTGDDGMGFLHMAAQFMRTEIVEILIREYGADPLAVCCCNFSAVEYTILVPFLITDESRNNFKSLIKMVGEDGCANFSHNIGTLLPALWFIGIMKLANGWLELSTFNESAGEMDRTRDLLAESLSFIRAELEKYCPNWEHSVIPTALASGFQISNRDTNKALLAADTLIKAIFLSRKGNMGCSATRFSFIPAIVKGLCYIGEEKFNPSQEIWLGSLLGFLVSEGEALREFECGGSPADAFWESGFLPLWLTVLEYTWTSQGNEGGAEEYLRLELEHGKLFARLGKLFGGIEVQNGTQIVLDDGMEVFSLTRIVAELPRMIGHLFDCRHRRCFLEGLPRLVLESRPWATSELGDSEEMEDEEWEDEESEDEEWEDEESEDEEWDALVMRLTRQAVAWVGPRAWMSRLSRRFTVAECAE